MRVGIFSDSINIPPKEGINVHTYNVACALATLPQTEVVLIVCDRGWLDLDILKKQPFDTIVLPSSEFYDSNSIAQIVKQYSIDILQTYMVYFAALVLGNVSFLTKKPMCVEFHDLEKDVAPLYMTDQTEIDFHAELQYRAGCLASSIRVMSAHDFAYIQQAWPEMSNAIVWMPVSIQDPKLELRKITKQTNYILFIGNTSYPPNKAAATFIQQSLAPKMPNVIFSLVGRGSERFSGPNVHALGMVDDLCGVLQSHSIGLAPIFEGSGMKIKLLDYLSAGMPVITTPLGAYGYPETDAIIVEAEVQKWPEILDTVLSNPSDLARRSVMARKIFMEHFNLDTNIQKLSDLYTNLHYNPTKSPKDFTDISVDQNMIYWLREIRETPRQPVTESAYFKGTKS